MEDDRSRPLYDTRDPSLSPELENEILRHVKRLCAGIHSHRTRIAVEEELADHFRLTIYDMALRGIAPERAFAEIAVSFGEPSILRQQLATVHNRLPPNFWSTVGAYLWRALIALAVTLPLWGILSGSGHTFQWYHALPGILIFVGLQPLDFLCSAVRRGRFHKQICRFYRDKGCVPLHVPSIWATIGGTPSASLYLLRIHDRTVAIKYRSAPHRMEVRFADEVTMLYIRRRRGIGLVDRHPRQFNLIRPAEIGDVTIRPVSYDYLLPPDWATAVKEAGGLEQLMVFAPYPMAVTCVKGNAVEEVIPGNRVFGFAVHSQISAIVHLLSLANGTKEDSDA